MRKLLTEVITYLVNKKANTGEYGVSIINLSDFDYAEFAKGIDCEKHSELFFLGFSNHEDLQSVLPVNNQVSYSFSVEDAETSRNTGDESRFRVLIIKRAEMQKLSSLKWFPEITLEQVYIESCDWTKKNLAATNDVVDSLITALKRKPIRSILSFERVLSFLEDILNADPEALPVVLKDSYYKLGLCRDDNLDAQNPNTEALIKKIKSNHAIVERIGNLEQAERQSINNYYTSGKGKISKLILEYYKTKDIDLLKSLEVSEVINCLKAAKNNPNSTRSAAERHPSVNPTAAAAQLIFDGDSERINTIIDQIAQDVDNRPNRGKAETIEVNLDDSRIKFKTEPLTEKIATDLIDDLNFGGVIRADVLSPSEALKDIDKYDYQSFDNAVITRLLENLARVGALVPDGESISTCLNDFIEKRKVIASYSTRLQDIPMLQVLSKQKEFSDYLQSYERLLTSISDDFPKIWHLAASNAKELVNTIVSLDNVFVVGDSNCHIIPTPLNPLYLWKYIKLAEEIVSGNNVLEINGDGLSEDDKAFVVRKAEDIPDPLSVMLLPTTIVPSGARYLPISGRLGCMPIYSTNKQINQSESGANVLEQSIIRYLCLYPHAGMMLRISIIDPPSVSLVVSMLKDLNKDKEFNISGIDLTIYRTKTSSVDWAEIEDASLNEGMLGKYNGNRSLNFNLKIKNKPLPYSRVISDLSAENHLIVIFDPSEVRVDMAQNDRLIHINPLCIPKVYQYNPIDDKVEIRPSNEGGVFSTYSGILEKLNEHPSAFSHTSTFFDTPLKKETYDSLLNKADWLVILDQSLKSWDISLSAESEKIFYQENDYRSVGIYSKNSNKFVLGYKTLIQQLGNYIPNKDGVNNIIDSIRNINDDGLLSIVSHSSNRIFDTNHGKGSLGLAIAAINYKRRNPKAILVGLDTQLAREWLSNRDDGILPDLIGINIHDNEVASIDLIEVKTYSNNINSFIIEAGTISGHAVEQATVLESLIKEIFGNIEKITTVSRRELLREQVFECLYESDAPSEEKHHLSEALNSLFAGEYALDIEKTISFVDFDNADSSEAVYVGKDDYANNNYRLITMGSDEIQSILSDTEYTGVASIDSLEASVSIDNIQVSSSINDRNEPNVPTDSGSMLDNEDGLEVQTEETCITNEVQQLNAHHSIIEEKCRKLNKVLRDYQIEAKQIDPNRVQEASRFTRFYVELKPGESIRKIERSKQDIAIQLEASGEILVNHCRGTNLISVDVPFARDNRPINLLENLSLLDSTDGFLNFVAGQEPDGALRCFDLASAPHLLVSGTTGSGKTIFLYSILVSLLKQFGRDELEVLIIDPKQTDFTFFEGLPNLYGGHVVVEAEEALKALSKINAEEKVNRTEALRQSISRDIVSYNAKNPTNKMKRLVVIIDEYADLIQESEFSGTRREFETMLVQLAQRVRNLGIHLVIATQRPTATIVTGALKANIPVRVSFRLPSHTDSQVILDMSGAENLLGKGDMLMVTNDETLRMQGLFITEDELTSFVESIKNDNEF